MENKIPDPKAEVPRLSNHEVQEKAGRAKDLLASDVFISAMNEVYSRAAGTLVNADVGSLTATGAHATMKAIVDIRNQLQDFINDNKMRQKYNKGDK
jgi:hypothetical protein